MSERTIELEMGLSEKDFADVLPNAVKPYRVTPTVNGYALTSDGLHIQIEKNILSPRVIASIQLPRMQVVLRFSDHNEAAVTVFMQRFNRYMHRGGG